jgi:hypothetical protein
VTLPNLSRLLAYPDAARDAAALIAAAPQMADLLVACEKALRETLFAESRQCKCVRCTAARDALARLAAFDRRLT